MSWPTTSRTNRFALGGLALLVAWGPLTDAADPKQDVALAEQSNDDSLEKSWPSGVLVEDCVVRFAQEIDVPALESGALIERRARQNEPIRRGELIARQDPASLFIRKRSALLQQQAAQEQLADDLDLQYAQAARAEASAELEANRNIYNDASGAVPLSFLRKLQLALERAELEVARANKQRRLAQIDVDLRSADLDLIENQISRLQIVSPVAGIVLEPYAEVGEWVTAGDPVVRVARLDRIHVHALSSIDRLHPRKCNNRVVTVTWHEGERKHVLHGRVSSVDPELLTQGRYRLHAEIENTRDGEQWRLLPGTKVQMTVHPVAAAPSAPDKAETVRTPPAADSKATNFDNGSRSAGLQLP